MVAHCLYRQCPCQPGHELSPNVNILGREDTGTAYSFAHNLSAKGTLPNRMRVPQAAANVCPGLMKNLSAPACCVL
jgi:hypothetical protein